MNTRLSFDQRHGWAIVDWAFLRSERISEDREVFASYARQAGRVTSPDRIVFAVLERDEPWWSEQLLEHPDENIIVQPIDRGSVPGVSLAAMSIARRDPQALVRLYGRVAGELSVEELVSTCEGQSPVSFQKLTGLLNSCATVWPMLDEIYPFLDREDLEVVV
ncbi:MAG: hypothetical protein KTR25_07900 [Myxococcales bacterium]|nr:hypothetical protein [Myxococcales bacterium]